MATYIRTNAELSIAERKIDEVEVKAAEPVKQVETSKPNPLSYEWFLNDGKSSLKRLRLTHLTR